MTNKIKRFLTMLVYPITWFTSSFNGYDGKASGKKFTAAFLTILTGFYSTKVHDMVTLYAFIALLAALLMLWGIISSSNIISFTRAIQSKEDNKAEDEAK